MQIEVLKVRQYGQNRFFPVCEISKDLTHLMSPRIAFKEKEIAYLKKRGWKIVVKENLS